MKYGREWKLFSWVCGLWGREEKFRFLVVGAYNSVFSYALFAGLFLLLNKRFNYIFILIIVHFVAVLNAFIGHKYFTFKAEGGVLMAYLRFNLSYLGALGAGVAGLPFLVVVCGLHPLVSQGLLSLFTMVGSYFLHKHISFLHT